MKKVLTTILFSFLLLFSFSKVAFAEKLEVVKEQNGRKCIDLTAYYEEVNNTSQAITGKAQSLDSVKKADHIATFTNIISFFVGNSIYCINDDVAASKTEMFKDKGVLGMLEEANFSLLSSLPYIGVGNHLAQEFVPNYKGNNASLASETHCIANMQNKTCCGREDSGNCSVYPGLREVQEEIGGRMVVIKYINEYDKNLACFDSKNNCESILIGGGSDIDDILDEEQEEGVKCIFSNLQSGVYCQQSHSQRDCDDLAEENQDGRIRFYDTLSECNDNKSEDEKEHQKILDADAAANKKGIKGRIVNTLLSYLGFGKIDFAEMERAATEEVVDVSGYKYLQGLNLDAMWSVMRNIAYLFFVLAMISIGFMIMFRNKIGGQVMVSVGNSIPRVLLSLVLVTFSFAISGILLDLGRMSIKVVNSITTRAQEKAGLEKNEVDIASINTLTDQALYKIDARNEGKASKEENLGSEDLLESTISEQTGGSSAREELGPWFGQTAKTSREVLLRMGAAFILDGIREANIPVADIVTDIVIIGFQIPNISRLLKTLVFLLIAAYASFKLFLTIFVSYAKIFMSVVIGPIQIALGAIPGNDSAIKNWFKTLLSHILVFPVIVGILGFSQFLSAAIDPEKFVFFGTRGVFLPDGIVTIKGVFFIAGYFFAASAPNMIKGFLKIEEDKTLSAAGASVKQSMSKIPMIGGMFGK